MPTNPSERKPPHARGASHTRPILLAIDTSTRTIGLAVFDGVEVLAENMWVSIDRHTIELAPAVQDLMSRSHIEFKSLQAIGVALGPGSFTGLRIGLALAKGIALAQHIPLIGIPSLDILAASQPPFRLPMAAALRAGRGRLAVGWYGPTPAAQPKNETSDDSSPASSQASVYEEEFSGDAVADMRSDYWKSTKPIEILTPQELSQRITTPTWICGEFTGEERQLLRRKWKKAMLASPAACLRRPAFLAELAWKRWQSGQIDDANTLSPIYLHYNEPVPG